jgi:hypothetical protein
MDPIPGTSLAPDSLDDEARIDDFLLRHGGRSTGPMRREESEGGLTGWSEVSAADGHVLRCEWSREGGRTEMTFREIAPETPGTGAVADDWSRYP